jgi:hypothetical protein
LLGVGVTLKRATKHCPLQPNSDIWDNLVVRNLSSLLFGLLTLGFLSACVAPTTTSPLRAVYLVQGQGELLPTDLAQHPEILVTNNLETFKQTARHRIALWIDKNSTDLVNEAGGWINYAPQGFYPIIMVGYNDPLIAFGYSLRLCCFTGTPFPDYSDAQPGFSVYERDSRVLSPPFSITVQGFRQTPTVDVILKISNDLLDGRIMPTPTLPAFNIPTLAPTPTSTP